MKQFVRILEVLKLTTVVNFIRTGHVLPVLLCLGVLCCSHLMMGQSVSATCPEIDLGPDLALPECFTPCSQVTLAATTTNVGETTSYSVEEILPYSVPYPSSFGTPVTFTALNQWSAPISLPFNFCFYGNTFDELLIGSNGALTFDVADYLGQSCPNNFTQTVPNPALIRNAIFGIYHGMEPHVCGTVRYGVDGVAPCRKFVINFDDICRYTCITLRTTTQIVLHESTNVIDVYIIGPLNICSTWNTGRAILGIQDGDGINGEFAPGINGIFGFGSDEGWRFTPNGTSAVTVDWFEQGGSYIGTGQTIDVCPDEALQTFVAEATFANCDGSSITLSDDIIVTCAQILLPVEWLGFEASLVDEGASVQCNWQTASEHNNDFFTIERSADGQQWSAIGTVDGSGTSSEVNAYTWIDRYPLAGTSYYRIRQTDYNGAGDVSDKRAIVRDAGALAFSVYPNPGDGLFNIVGVAPEAELRVYDIQGREVAVRTEGQQRLDLRHASEGHYIIEVRLSDAIKPRRQLIQIRR
jgi:hypothetical protein